MLLSGVQQYLGGVYYNISGPYELLPIQCSPLMHHRPYVCWGRERYVNQNYFSDVMSINRKIFKLPFRGKGLTRWRCPTCGKGLLKVKDGTFHYEEKRNSKWARSDELENSFSLFFCDPPSAANHVRMALEMLMTRMKIQQYRVQNGKRRYLSLHERIMSFPKKYHDIQDLFMAVKWLGNAGSHSGTTVSADDVFDAYELMEKLLAEVFYEESKKLKALAKKINENKGPSSKSMFA